MTGAPIQLKFILLCKNSLTEGEKISRITNEEKQNIKIEFRGVETTNSA